MNRILFLVASLAILLSACAPAATPTIDPAQIQASAMAAAGTMIALTKAAIPTATPLPPTELPTLTPLPSPTLGVLPAVQGFFTPTPAASSGGADDCNHPMDVGASGPTAPVLINNDTKGPVTFTLYLGRKNSFGQCGWQSWGSIAKGNSIMVDVPYARLNQGDPCYWASAFVNDPKHQSTPSNGPFCINNPDKWTFDVSYDRIKLTPP